jgi:hypothetical protein
MTPFACACAILTVPEQRIRDIRQLPDGTVQVLARGSFARLTPKR